MKPGDLVRGQAVYAGRDHRNKGGEGNPPFEWVHGTLSKRAPRDQGRMVWVEVPGGDRMVWASTLELVASKAQETQEVTPRGAVLREAEKLITGDRNKTYGSPVENFDVTAALWTQQLGHKLKAGESFTATDVALLMIQLKMARLRTSPGTRDHYVDISGYAACGWECQEVEDASA